MGGALGRAPENSAIAAESQRTRLLREAKKKELFFSWRNWPWRRGRRTSVVVRFAEKVQVSEYRRSLGGGGGVPKDGVVALGLGSRVRVCQAPLGKERQVTGPALLDEYTP